MKLLLDQDVYWVTAQFLQSLGLDVIRAAEVNLARASDEDILYWCRQQKRILVTRDKDFGELIFLRDISAGVIFLRISPSIIQSIHQELRLVLERYSEESLHKAFVVIEVGRHRFRKLPY